MKHIVLTIMLLSIVGCSNGRKSIIVLQHPETNQTVECKGDPWTDLNPWTAAEKCAEDYKTAGFVILGEDN